MAYELQLKFIFFLRKFTFADFAIISDMHVDELLREP